MTAFIVIQPECLSSNVIVSGDARFWSGSNVEVSLKDFA